jgi:hypothetical protein
MLSTSTTGHHPAVGHRHIRHLGCNRPGLLGVSGLSIVCKYATRTLLAAISTARSSAPVVAAAAVPCEQIVSLIRGCGVAEDERTVALLSISLLTPVTTLLLTVPTRLLAITALLALVSAATASIAAGAAYCSISKLDMRNMRSVELTAAATETSSARSAARLALRLRTCISTCLCAM